MFTRAGVGVLHPPRSTRSALLWFHAGSQTRPSLVDVARAAVVVPSVDFRHTPELAARVAGSGHRRHRFGTMSVMSFRYSEIATDLRNRSRTLGMTLVPKGRCLRPASSTQASP